MPTCSTSRSSRLHCAHCSRNGGCSASLPNNLHRENTAEMFLPICNWIFRRRETMNGYWFAYPSPPCPANIKDPSSTPELGSFCYLLSEPLVLFVILRARRLKL